MPPFVAGRKVRWVETSGYHEEVGRLTTRFYCMNLIRICQCLRNFKGERDACERYHDQNE